MSVQIYIKTTDPAPPTGVSASALTAEGREHLMWCTDDEFDRSLEQLSQRGLLELIQLLQDAMLIEQQTFDSLQQQLESAATASAQRQRLSAALCTSQARLTRLCGRSMRCFTQQAMRARQRVTDRADEPESGSPPVDTAAISSNFKQNLTFFQKAAHNLTRSTPPARSRPTPRRSSVGSDGSSGSSVASAASVGDDDFEPVLFVNGRPRYVTSEAASAPIGGAPVSAAGAADGPAVDDGARTAAERTDRAAQKVRIGGTAAERIRAGGKSAAERAASSSPARSGRTQQPTAAQSSVSDTSRERSYDSRERSSSAPAKREKPSASSHSSERLSSTTPSKRERAGSNDSSSIAEKPSSRSSSRRDSERQLSTDSDQPANNSEVQPPRRKPYIRFGSVENHLSHDDLTYFKQTIGILPGGGGITRTQSCQEGLDSPARPAPVSRTLSFSCLADVGGEPRSLSGSRTSLRRAPSVEEILESVKALRVKRQQDEMVRNSEPEAEYQNVGIKSSSRSGKGRPAPWSGVQFSGPVRNVESDDPALTPDDACYENVSAGGQAVYQNSPLKSEVIYDQPVKQRRRRRKTPEEPQQLYENVQFSDQTGGEYQNTTLLSKSQQNLSEPDAVYENVEKGVVSVSGNGLLSSGQYDVPRTASHIYDAPQRTRIKNVQPAESGEYDSPRPTYGPGRSEPLPTRSTQIVLKGGMAVPAVEQAQDCDRDSLDGDGGRRPDIPSPDYGSDGDDVDGIPNDYIGDDQLDEGLGESDARSYYNEDPGLEVILEEPEDEYVTSSEEEEEEQESPQTRSLHSLEGSEGIGSAEGDSGSNASVESSSGVHSPGGSPTLREPSEDREERIQKDRCVEVYPETMRQRKHAKKQKQVDGKPWSDASEAPRRADDSSKTIDSPTKIKKLLPSVKALKSQFESAAPPPEAPRRFKERSPPTNKMATEVKTAERPQQQVKVTDPAPVSSQRASPVSAGGQRSSVGSPARSSGGSKKVYIPDDPVEAIYDKFGEVDERMLKQKITTLSWDPTTLVSRLYDVPEPAQRPKDQEKGYVNIEGWLEKLPSGRKKATFWNAWKRRYFKAKDGFLYYYQTNTTEKPSMVLQLMGGHVEAMESSVVGIDDGKGRYVVVRCNSRPEAERWTRALLSHTVEDYNATYVQPVPVPVGVTTSRRCVVIDLGSSSIRAGVLHEQPTLPQLFFPAAMVTSRDGGAPVFGSAALRPEARAGGTLSFPLRPSSKITKHSVDVQALSGLLQLTFRELRINPSDYCVQLSLPRSFNTATLGEILRLLFDKFGAQGVNLTHQSILAMWSYNATSGVVVDVGDRMDVVPVIDGYIVEGGVSRVPYGGARIQDHLRHFLLQKHYSLVTEVESLLLRYVMERLCFVSEQYGADLRQFSEDPASVQKTVSVKEFLGENVSWKRITLDSGRFQATEGLFNPDAWGLDNKGVHKLVHKAVQECSVDIRKEMVRSIYLAGGVTLLPGFAERLQAEMDKLTPPSVTPKVHASPYRYHAAYLGACVLAGSEGFQQAMVPRSSWLKLGVSALKKWTV
ncbi:uncharacterized protein LOC122383995 isoform X4 [Amphibalanus amphitrite]|uniref:uncharacterized protein LOC122383995 isoform X4 n=1 Tax=Amphibalanus amphitrite TaxID=1232801 RepID=UPI001C911B86|nr:uncharacterized protein LOC122383995 isoform X4 [Amphibalanus amphitrite]